MAYANTLHRNHILNPYSSYKIPLPVGLVTSLFLNGTPFDGISDVGLVAIAVGAGGELLEADIATVKTVNHPLGGFNIYMDDLKIQGITPYTDFYIAIYRATTGEVLVKSNCFTARPQEDYLNLAFLSYRNSTDIYGFQFEALPNFRQELFLDLNVIDTQAEVDKETYSEVTTGYVRPKKTYTKVIHTIESQKFDATAHEGMMGLADMDDIKLDGRVYQPVEGYSYEASKRTSRTNGSIQFYDQAANEVNLKR
jgi:hypothetical protein